MSYAVIGTPVSGNSTSGNDVTSPGYTTTGADLIVIGVACDESGLDADPTDSMGNAWTPLTKYEIALGITVRLWYKFNPTTSAGHTFTYTRSATFPAIAVAAFSGAASSPFEDESGTTNAAGTTIQPGSKTPAENNELLVTCLAFGATNTASIDSSFIVQTQANYQSGQSYGVAFATKIQTSLGAENPQWSVGGSTSLATAMALFKAAAGVAGNDAKIVFRKA